MRTILFLIRKEFLQIFRNRFISRAIFAVPLVQMLILVPAVTFELRNVIITVLDRDMTPESRGLINKIDGSEFFKVEYHAVSEKDADDILHSNKSSVILEIPSGFGKEIVNGRTGSIMTSIDAVNASNAEITWAYLSGVIRDYNLELPHGNASGSLPARVDITNRYWFNENLNYKYFMLPGILVILVTAIGFLLAGLNMVREKEIGTIEQINVTPVKKYQFIAAKMIPFLIIGLVDLALGLSIGRIAFHIPFEGSIFTMFLCASIFLVAVLALALFISTFSSTQQQYMFVAFFFMIIFILMSGIFTPMESMPQWAQDFDIVNPVAYLIKINRMVMLKGSGLSDISQEVYSLILIAVGFSSLAVWRYRKTA